MRRTHLSSSEILTEQGSLLLLSNKLDDTNYIL